MSSGVEHERWSRSATTSCVTPASSRSLCACFLALKNRESVTPALASGFEECSVESSKGSGQCLVNSEIQTRLPFLKVYIGVCLDLLFGFCP